MKNLDFEGLPDIDVQTIGHYFKSTSNNQMHYLVAVFPNAEKENCGCNIYSLDDTPQIKLVNGDLIAAQNVFCFCVLDIWPKNYMIKFEDGYHQFYHDYEGNGKEDYAQGMADVINFALKLGIEQAKITLR